MCTLRCSRTEEEMYASTYWPDELKLIFWQKLLALTSFEQVFLQQIGVVWILVAVTFFFLFPSRTSCGKGQLKTCFFVVLITTSSHYLFLARSIYGRNYGESSFQEDWIISSAFLFISTLNNFRQYLHACFVVRSKRILKSVWIKIESKLEKEYQNEILNTWRETQRIQNKMIMRSFCCSE